MKNRFDYNFAQPQLEHPEISKNRSTFEEGNDCKGSVMATSNGQYFDTLCSVLRGESVAWPHVQDAEAFGGITELARYHGVISLIYHCLKQNGCLNLWPSELVDSLRAQARQEAAREAICSHELSMVLRELAGAGVFPLLLKGTALAYSLYPQSALRYRADTDLLIDETDRSSLSQVLSNLGYARCYGITGDLVSAQSTFARQDRFAVYHNLDVHWRISNFHVFNTKLSYAELAADAISLEPLGDNARTLGPIHALMLACMHRLGHRQAPYYVDGVAHFDSDRLIWLYDIDLLARSMSVGQWRQFISAVVSKQLQLICLDGLKASRRVFGTSIPDCVEESFVQPPRGEVLTVSRFQVPRWRWELSEVWALPTWHERFKLLREHLLPAPAYLSGKYDLKHPWWLPLFYVHRAFAGIWKRL